LFFRTIILLSTAIITKYINDNRDSFVDINDFDLEDKGADVNKLEDNNADPTILLSNTPLDIIIKEDKAGDRLVFSP
jgi:hypothetical protein